MASESLTGIHNLPYDTLFSIFSFLPIPDLARCAAVCKQWNEIVTGFTHLWKGKRYISDRSPRESVETYAIMRTLPPLQEVIIKAAGEFVIDIFYPRLVLLVTDVSDIGSEEDGPRLRCTYIATRDDIAKAVLESPSLIDYATLQKLRIVKTIPVLDVFARKRNLQVCRCTTAISSVDDAIGFALERCPNMKELCIYAEFLSEDRLDAPGGIAHLRALEIECPGLEELTFLRRCSDVLEELELKGCADLPSAAYAGLHQLGNLRRLRLRDCCVGARDLEVAAKGLKCLTLLHLDCCDLVSDLSCLRHCEQLQELRVKASPPDTPLTGLGSLPADLRSLYLSGNAVAVDELSEATRHLRALEELHLIGFELPHLGFLRHCLRLRRLCLEFSRWPNSNHLLTLRHLTWLEALDLTRCRVDPDVLCSVLPSLSRLDSLSLSHAEDVVHLRFLRHCHHLRTLSLFYTYGMELEAYHELCHLTNLQNLHITNRVREFVHEVVTPCLPKVKIFCSEQYR